MVTETGAKMFQQVSLKIKMIPQIASRIGIFKITNRVKIMYYHTYISSTSIQIQRRAKALSARKVFAISILWKPSQKKKLIYDFRFTWTKDSIPLQFDGKGCTNMAHTTHKILHRWNREMTKIKRPRNRISVEAEATSLNNSSALITYASVEKMRPTVATSRSPK